jgi:type VI secretion system secreted protein Hcp
MAFQGYLKIADINGESHRADHEDEIDIHGLQWSIQQDSSTNTGRGRRQSRAKVDQLVLTKHTDAASPYLALATMQGKRFDEIQLSVRKDSGEAHLDYLVITMTNCLISGFDMNAGPPDTTDSLITEKIAITFEKIKMIYTVQADDHSAGDEHEIEFDIAAGV